MFSTAAGLEVIHRELFHSPKPLEWETSRLFALSDGGLDFPTAIGEAAYSNDDSEQSYI